MFLDFFVKSSTISYTLFGGYEIVYKKYTISYPPLKIVDRSVNLLSVFETKGHASPC